MADCHIMSDMSQGLFGDILSDDILSDDFG